MTRQLLRSLLIILASVLVWVVAGADEPSDQACDGAAVPMPEDERQQITLSLLERYPELASSPGVKTANIPPSGCRYTSAMTIVHFYPHADSRGIKEAVQAACGREYPDKTWKCEDVSIRRYVRLPSQDVEVQIAADITFETALALIEATRRYLPAVTDIADRPDTAILIMPHLDLGVTWNRTPEAVLMADRRPGYHGDPKLVGYSVTWGTQKGYPRLRLIATLTEGGEPTNPDDWHASLYRSPIPQ